MGNGRWKKGNRKNLATLSVVLTPFNSSNFFNSPSPTLSVVLTPFNSSNSLNSQTYNNILKTL